MKGARVQTDMEYTSSSCVWKNQIAYILCVSRRVHWYALPPCTLWKALASDINPVPPLAEFCVPCVPSGTGSHSQPSHKTTQVPSLAPGGPVWRFPPRVGERPVPARSGAGLGHTEPSLAEKKKTAQPGKQPPAQMENMPAFDLPPGARFPQKPAVVKGVKKEQVKGPGSLEASRAGSLRPAEPVVEGFFPGVNFPVFRGRFGCLGVTTGVRKAKFPGGKPFLRVSPPGSTKG